MKPAPFEYSRPADIDEACALLAADDGARMIAGGQTLVPLMAMRLARPSRLIDIARIPGSPTSATRATRSRSARRRGRPRSRAIRWCAPSCRCSPRSMPFVGHARDAGARHGRRLARQRRSGGGDRAGRGDARRDAAAGATAARDHEIAAADFFVGPMTTALPYTAACSTEVRFPVWRSREVGIGLPRGQRARRAISPSCRPRRRSRVDADGRCTRVAVGVGARDRVSAAARRGGARRHASAEEQRARGRRARRSSAHRADGRRCMPPPIIAGASR